MSDHRLTPSSFIALAARETEFNALSARVAALEQAVEKALRGLRAAQEWHWGRHRRYASDEAFIWDELVPQGIAALAALDKQEPS